MADNQALGELAAQDRYDPIVPAPVRLSQPQVLGGLADLGSDTVDPVVLPQNPNPLADNPFSHYVAQKLFGLGQNAVSALSVPGDVWRGNLDPTSDEGMNRAIGLAQMITEAPRGGGAGPGTVLGSGIRAYHGSPYDFDRFDINQIGTGEGAQAYGHGLYFAENPSVAQSYKTAGTISTPIQYKEQGILSIPRSDFDAIPEATRRALVFARHDANVSEAISNARNSGHEEIAKELERLTNSGTLRDMPKTGKMYEVNINAHPDEFLDWDKPLANQPAVVQDLARTADLSHLQPSNRTRVMLEKFRAGQEQDHYPAIGHTLHNALEDYGAKPRPELSAYLNDQGIPGIKYLDQGSRGSGVGTSNYVVFNDRLIDILRKYGLAGLTAGTGATAAGQQMDNSAPFGMIGAVPVAGGAMGSLARQDQYQQ